MRSLILLFCFMFGFVALSNQESFGDFSYDIDRFTVVSGSSSFVDEFDDGEEPPSGPSGPSTYFSTPFSADAESGGMLNLNSNDAIIGDDPSMDIVVSLTDNTYFFNSGSGGRLEGKFRFINGFGTNTGFIITIHDTPLSELESSSLYIQKEISGRIVAYFDFWIPGTGGSTIISQIDVTDLLGTSTDITLRLDINTANVVTASLDIGSKGTFDLTMPGSYTLTFPGETKHTGAFLAFEGLEPTPDIKANGSDEPVTPIDNLSVTVALAPKSRSGENADWWVVADTPFGWFHYDVPSGSWVPDLAVTFQGSLFDLPPFEVLSMSGLPTGNYTFYFGVDMVMNGSLDMSDIFYDSVVVNITP